MKLLTHIPQDIDAEELLKDIASIPLTPAEYKALRVKQLGVESAVLAHRSDGK
jgi:hypothetical protein